MAGIGRTANPALSGETFSKEAAKNPTLAGADQDVMTVDGTVWRTLFLFVILLLPAYYTWNLVGTGANLSAYMWGGAIGGLVVAVVTIFKKEWSPYTAPLYTFLQGLFLGAISGIFESQFQGITLQAVGLTFSTLFLMLTAYLFGWIQVTEKFRSGVMIATGSVGVVYLISMVANLFGGSVPYIHGSGVIGIGFSLVVVGIAALNLLLDFEFIHEGAEKQAPKYMEWFSAFGLMVTLIWLYIEILRLLSKIRNN